MSQDEVHPLIFTPYYSESMRIQKKSLIGKLLADRSNKIFEFKTDSKINSIEIILKDQTKLGTVESPNIDLILSNASISAFGKNGETIIDTNVRNGKEINFEQFDTSFIENIENSFKENNQAKIGENMKIKNLQIKFRKMAIYTEGGHFSKHRDTPYADNHLGTLLTPITSNHEGGTLVLYGNNGFEHHWSTKNAQSSISFFTDIEHQVLSVDKGTRIVLQFDLLSSNEVGEKRKMEETNEESTKKTSVEETTETKKRKQDYDEDDNDDEDGDEDENDDEDDNDDEEDENDTDDDETLFFETNQNNLDPFSSLVCLEKIMEEIDSIFQNSKNPIALPLGHLYRNKSLVPDLLKGSDYELYQKLLNSKYNVYLSQIVAEEVKYYDYKEYNKTDVSACDPPNNIPKEIDWGNVTYFVSAGSSFENFFYQQYVEYTGNEAQPEENRYFGGIFLITPKTEEK